MPKTPEMGDGPDVWSVYLASDDAAKSVESAVGHGGTVIVPAMQITDIGSMAMVADPGGAAIGIWQPGVHTGLPTPGRWATGCWTIPPSRWSPSPVWKGRRLRRP